MTNEEREALLVALRSDAGQAEGASGRTRFNYYPVTEHLRALEPEVVLVVGDRGAGKSQLAAVAEDASLRKAAMRRAPGMRFAEGDAQWTRAYPMDYGPDHAGLQSFAVRHRDSVKTAA